MGSKRVLTIDGTRVVIRSGVPVAKSSRVRRMNGPGYGMAAILREMRVGEMVRRTKSDNWDGNAAHNVRGSVSDFERANPGTKFAVRTIKPGVVGVWRLA